jgi:starch phosphorylase
MKAGINGALQFTVSDGWVAEVDMADKGWVLSSSEITELYDILEKEVVPMFYERNEKDVPSDWVTRMRNIITTIENNYTATRMLEEYLNKLYFPGMSMPYRLFHR